MRGLGIERKKQRPNEVVRRRCVLSFADAKLAKTESRISSVPTSPIISPTACERVAQIDRDDIPARAHPSSRRARRSHDSRARAQTIAMARIDRERAFRAQVSCVIRRENLLLQTAQSVFRQAGNPQRIIVFPIGMFRQIAFVQKHDLGWSVTRSAKSARFRRVAIEDVQKQIGRLRAIFSCARSLRAPARPAESRNTGGIEQANRNAAQIDHFFDRVARRAGNFADDGAVETKQAIEQTRFPGVGRRRRSRRARLRAKCVLVPRSRGGRAFFANGIEPRAQVCRASSGAMSFLGKIDRGFDMREHLDQFVANAC